MSSSVFMQQIGNLIMLVIFMHTLQPVMWEVMVSSSMSLGHKPYQDYDYTEVGADISQQIIIFCT